jgi:hypothetical protein
VTPDEPGSESGAAGSVGSVRDRTVETLFRDRRRNAGLFWLVVGLLVVAAAGSLAVGDPLSAVFEATVVGLAVLVPISYRSPLVTLPWELVAVAAVPTVGRALLPGTVGVVATYLAVAAVALILAVELQAFTPGVSMSHGFAALFVVVTTLAAAGVWALVRWLGGIYLGTPPLTDETALMWEFVGSTVAGGVAGLAMRPYLGRRAYTGRLPQTVGRAAERPPTATREASAGAAGTPEREERPGPVGRLLGGRLRDRLGIPVGVQVAATRLMEYTLVGLLFIGLERRTLGIVVNAGVALVIVQLPALLERDHEIPMDPAVTLWITSAAFLHAVGVVGLPGADINFYRSIWWWDHLTHSLSASVVAAVGYATVRAIDRHSDAVSLPPRFVFVFILSFVVAFGVLWEVLEFALGGLGSVTGGSILTQYGLGDTMVDLLFNLAGGVVVAVWGTAHLTDVTGALVDRLDRRQASGDS